MLEANSPHCEFSCVAILHVEKTLSCNTGALDLFESLYRPDAPYGGSAAWAGDWGREPRIVALCLAAAIAKAEGK